MSTTTNLAVTLIEESQNQKEVTANEAFEIFDGAIAGLLTVDLTGLSGNVTPTATSVIRCLVIKCSGALGADVNLIVPNNNHAYMLWHNGTDFDVIIKTVAGSGVTLNPTEAQFVYCDGTNVIGIAAVGSGSAIPIDKTVAFKDGLGAVIVLPIGANVDPTTVEVYVQGLRLRRGSGKDYQVTESSPGSGTYDQITPEYLDAIPVGTDNVEIAYYGA